MRTSDHLDQLAEALSTLQTRINNPIKDAKAHHSKYASFPSVLNAIRPHLEECGLAIVQVATKDFVGKEYPIQVMVVTRLIHKSGQWIEEEISAPMDQNAKNDIQQMGSLISYLKRYAIQGMFLITGDDDDDGVAAVSTQPAKVEQPSLKQIGMLRDLIEKKGLKVDQITKAYGVEEIEDLDLKQFSEVTVKLNKKPDVDDRS